MEPLTRAGGLNLYPDVQMSAALPRRLVLPPCLLMFSRDAILPKLYRERSAGLSVTGNEAEKILSQIKQTRQKLPRHAEQTLCARAHLRGSAASWDDKRGCSDGFETQR